MLVKLMSDLLVDGEILSDNVKAVIFDKDGTLIDIHHYWSSMIRIRASLIALKYFKNSEKERLENDLIDIMGVNLETGKMKPEGPIGVKPRSFIVDIVTDFVQKNGYYISNSEVEELFKKVDQTTSQDILPLLKILPGVKELLIKLKQCDIHSIIVSTDITSRAHKAMKALKLDKYFIKIIGGDLVNNPKPAPDSAKLALSGIDCETNSVVVIGDHPVDVKMGESINAGLNIGVLTGLSNSTMFDNLNCIVINDLNCIKVSC
jgi:phosphoglycolate phosphatase